jgi:hypothetical protein
MFLSVCIRGVSSLINRNLSYQNNVNYFLVLDLKGVLKILYLKKALARVINLKYIRDHEFATITLT